ncbi:MAG: RNA polymerase sigma factor [Myxococcales bacterium]|nr:RNA polymerase sigma factor [Myxococcales bacterium]
MRVPIEFARIYRDHHDRVWRCLAALGVPEAALDDAAQDVFVIAYRRITAYDGRAPVRAWLYGIARKVALKHRERAFRRARERLRLVDAARTDEGGAPAPDEQVARSEAVSVVESCLERLDEDKRAVFVLSELEGLRAPEVAEALGIKLNTVYSRLRAARALFNRELERRRAQEDRLERRLASPSGGGGHR